MTVIAYRDGVLASDSKGVFAVGSEQQKGRMDKVYLSADGTFAYALCGLVGNEKSIRKLETNLRTMLNAAERDGCFPEDEKYGIDFLQPMIVMTKNVVVTGGTFGPRIVTDIEFATVGSGCNESQAAMVMGATAIEAVEHAIRHCDSCGGPIQAVTVDDLEDFVLIEKESEK